MSSRDPALRGKTALVTGASRGIGKAIALRLASDGATVAVHHGANREQAEDTAARIAQAGGSAYLVAGDLATPGGIDAVVAAMEERANGAPYLDILVNNAGRQVKEGPSADESAFDHLFAVNVKAPFFLVQRLAPLMKDGGRIITISSGLSMIGFPEKMVYGMTKAATNSMTRSFAKELGPRGITVNAVLPGIIETDMNPWVRNPEAAAQVAARSVLNRVGKPEDIAGVVSFLASPDARWVTGELIDASGGARV